MRHRKGTEADGPHAKGTPSAPHPAGVAAAAGTLLKALLLLAASAALATLCMRTLNRSGVTPPAARPEEGGAHDESFGQLFSHTGLTYTPFTYAAETKRVGPMLKNACFSGKAGIISMRHISNASRVEVYLLGRIRFPIVTEIVEGSVPPRGVVKAEHAAPARGDAAGSAGSGGSSQRSMCLVLLLPSDGGGANPFFEIVLPLLRSEWGPTAVCQGMHNDDDPVVVLITPHPVQWLDRAPQELLKSLFDIDFHVNLPTKFKSLEAPWICAESTYVISPDPLKGETERTYDLPTQAEREASWGRVFGSAPEMPGAQLAGRLVGRRGLFVAMAGIDADWDLLTHEALALGFYPVTLVRGRAPFKKPGAYRDANEAQVLLAGLPALAGAAYWMRNTTSVICVTSQLASLQEAWVPGPGDVSKVDCVLTRHMLNAYGFADYTALPPAAAKAGVSFAERERLVVDMPQLIATLRAVLRRREAVAKEA